MGHLSGFTQSQIPLHTSTLKTTVRNILPNDPISSNAHGHTSEKGDSFVKYYGQKMIPLNTFYGMTTFGEYAIPLFPSIP